MKYYVRIDNIKMKDYASLNDAILTCRTLEDINDSITYKNLTIEREDGIIYSMNEYGNFTFERKDD